MNVKSLLTTAVATLMIASANAQDIIPIPNAFSGETLTHNKLFVPEGDGPFPAVVIMHGSGGLWSNDNVEAGVMSNHFEEWAVMLNDAGMIALFVDSYTPRGEAEWRSKSPSDNPAVDDSKISDRKVRVQDAYSALAYLQSRTDVIDDRVALMGFSHGGQSTLASVVSSSIVATKASWKINREVLQQDGTYKKQLVAAEAPYTLENEAEGFRTAVAYYPGCGFFSYFGSSSATTSKNYMPYCPTLMIHGSTDSLHAANGYTTALVGKSQSHANLLGLAPQQFPLTDENDQPIVSNNPLQHVVLPGLGHSFDELKANQNGFNEMVTMRARVMVWLEEQLVD